MNDESIHQSQKLKLSKQVGQAKTKSAIISKAVSMSIVCLSFNLVLIIAFNLCLTTTKACANSVC